MQLSDGGVISGTPGSPNLYDPQIKVADSAAPVQNVATKTFSFSVGVGGSLTSRAVLSQIAAGAGWDTTLYLVNTAYANSNTATVTFRGDNGSPLPLALTQSQQGNTIPVTASVLTVSLNPGTSVVLHTAATPGSPLQQGWADIWTTGGITSYAIFRQTLANGSINEGTSASQGQLQTSLFVPYDNTGGNTGTASLVNLSLGPVTPLATIFDEYGAQLGTQTLSLPAMGHMAFAMPTTFTATYGRRGFVRFDSSSPDAITGLALSFNGAAFTSVPAFPPVP